MLSEEKIDSIGLSNEYLSATEDLVLQSQTNVSMFAERHIISVKKAFFGDDVDLQVSKREALVYTSALIIGRIISADRAQPEN